MMPERVSNRFWRGVATALPIGIAMWIFIIWLLTKIF